MIAGMLDSDGTLINNGTGYKISQCEAHLAILIHIRKMCLSISIRVGKVDTFEASHPTDPDTMLPAYRFSLFGSGLEKLQPYLMARKRRAQREYRDWESKTLRVDPFPSKKLVDSRAIHVLGRDDALILLDEGWVQRASPGHSTRPTSDQHWLLPHLADRPTKQLPAPPRSGAPRFRAPVARSMQQQRRRARPRAHQRMPRPA